MSTLKKQHAIFILSLAVMLSFMMHFKHLTKDLVSMHVWRQTQTQSTITNFCEEDFNILNPRKNDRGNGNGIFRMEFPLMQWCVAAICKIGGNRVVITRICMFIIGIFSVMGMYKLLQALFQQTVLAVMGAWAFNFSPCFYYYTINPLPDNLALCCSIWGLAFFFLWLRKKRNYLLFLSGILLSTGALCKLPFILCYIVPAVYFFRKIIKSGLNKNNAVHAILIGCCCVFPLAWYLCVIPGWSGNGIVKGMADNKISASVFFDYLQHNLISTLPELLINYGSVLFFIAGFIFLIKNKAYNSSLFPIVVIWSSAILLYFLFELNMIAKIHDYYLFPFYPLIFILVAYGAYNMFAMKSVIKYLVLFLLMILPLTAYLRMHTRWDTNSPGFNKDLLVYKNELRNIVPQKALCIAGNDNSHFIFFYYIDKKGWIIDQEHINENDIQTMIRDGAEFLYSDTRAIDENPAIVPLLDKLLLEKGTIRVFRLKDKSNMQK
jgi:hypothetical protein